MRDSCTLWWTATCEPWITTTETFAWMASWNCGGISLQSGFGYRGNVALWHCVRASVICKQTAVCRLSCGRTRSITVRLVRGRGVSAMAYRYYARRDPSATNELAGLEALLNVVDIATCFECILFMSLPIVSLDPLGLVMNKHTGGWLGGSNLTRGQKTGKLSQMT